MTTRRTFLKGAVAAGVVAALPALPAFAEIVAPLTDRERLQNMLDAGTPVVGQSFVIRGGDPIICPPGARLFNSSFEFVDGAGLQVLGVAHITCCCFVGSTTAISFGAGEYQFKDVQWS